MLNFDILAIIDADFLENDVELNAEIEKEVKNIPSLKDSTRYPCNFSDKVCLSKGGLTRHLNTKHSNENSVQKSSPAAKKPKKSFTHCTSRDISRKVLQNLQQMSAIQLKLWMNLKISILILWMMFLLLIHVSTKHGNRLEQVRTP